MAAIGLIRNKLGWLLVGVMVLALIAFLLMGISGNGGGGNFQVSDELATVDGEVISNQVFNDNLSTNITNYKNQTQKQSLTDADLNGLKNSTYNQMITDKLFDKIYAETGVSVSNAEFLDMLSGKHIHQGIKNSFKGEDGQFDLSLFTNYINSLDIENNPQDAPGTKRKAWKSFETAILKERLTKKYNNLVEKSMTVPTFIAKDAFLNSKEQVTFNYVKVPYSSIADSSLNLSDSDLKSFLQKNAKEFQQEESVDIKFASFPIIASQNDNIEASEWIDAKVTEWAVTEDDSSFVNLYSDVAYDVAYYGKDELLNAYKDSIFNSKIGTIFGPDKNAGTFVATKLIDRKMIPDSLQARHLLISLDGIKTQEEAIAKYKLYDSIFNLIDSANYQLSSLTAEFSDDKSNALAGGDLNWVKPNQMVKPFNDMIFFDMKEGDVRKVATKFGLHIVEVYNSKATKEAVKVATLKKEILASAKTQEKIYADASVFSGNNNTIEKFEAAEESTIINSAFGITKESNTIQKIQGNARQIIKWAFNEAKIGEVSSPFSVGETYYVALLVNKNEKGLMSLNDNTRLRIETAAAVEKKAEILKNKMQGQDLNSIATTNNTTVESAQNVSFANVTIGGIQEPTVVGAALGMAEKVTSPPIQGVDGVYVINVSSKTEATEDLNAIDAMKNTLRTQVKTSVSSRINNAIRKSAEIKDNRFNFF